FVLNTNGTRITPSLARLFKRRKGSLLVALYGATPEVHDHITRTPGSFAELMQGIAYLREASVGFTVQVVVLRDNRHQRQEMIQLAESLSPSWRYGAGWLYLSASGASEVNREIVAQRLDPSEAIALDPPNVSYLNRRAIAEQKTVSDIDDRLFAECVSQRKDFHIDPYGQMSFCAFIKDPALRYDLKKGGFREAWEKFIPSLADSVRGGKEYQEACGSCSYGDECRWCPVFGYLEHGRYSARVEYLCRLSQENRRYQEAWRKDHSRFFRVGDITIQVDSDLPFKPDTFHETLRQFQVDGPSEDMAYIAHHFGLPPRITEDLGQPVYHRPPWAVYRRGEHWIYIGISRDKDSEIPPHRVAVFNDEHSSAQIYNPDSDSFVKGANHALTMFPTDQIMLSRLLAHRQGCIIHSSGVVMDGQGLLFVGHSEAGKSTTVDMIKQVSTVLCDDRIIVRLRPDGYRIYGTWSHGTIPEVSAASAPLRAVFLLEKAPFNRIQPIENRVRYAAILASHVIRPLLTTDWWDRTIAFFGELVKSVPVYRLQLDLSGQVVELLKHFLAGSRD
ncbi:MAG: hypothetical protein ABIK62_02630, partial [candidate division WOR-3 bacterium]